MYTAKIINKNSVNGGIELDVEFTNGTDTFVEKIIPQDKQGFDFWVESRLKSLDSKTEFEEDDNIDKVITLPQKPIPTAEEVAKNEWFKNFSRLERVNRLVQLGILTGDEAPIIKIKADLAKNFKPAYIADM